MTATLDLTASVATPPAREGSPLVAEISDFDGGVLVRVEGDAGITGLERFQFVLARVIARRSRLAVLDLAGLTFVSSLAIGVLVRLRRDLGRWNGRVRLAGCPAAIREALVSAGVAELFEYHTSVAEARAAA